MTDSANMTVDLVLADISKRFPDRPALIMDDGQVTYAELVTGVGRVARWLADQGVGPEDRVGITIAEEFDHLVVGLALLRLGSCQVTLSSFDPPHMRRALAERLGLSTVVASDAGLVPAGIPALIPDIPGLFANGPRAADLPAQPDPDATVLILTSSGTTGRPKLIPLSHRLTIARSADVGFASGGTRSYRPTPIEFNPGKRALFFALLQGNRCLLPRRHDVERIPELCRTVGIDHLAVTSPQAQTLVAAMRKQGHALPETTVLYHLGSAFAPALRSRVERFATRNIYVTYGATEYGMICIAPPGEARPNVVGPPQPGVELEIRDADGNPVEGGAVGEIRVRGPGMATTYLDDGELSARAFRDGWYHTGDLGRRLPDGSIEIAGRADEMMSMNSVNIFPQEIEAAIEGYPGVIECAAFPLASSVHGDIPMAAVRVEEGVDLAALLRHCRERLGIRAPRRLVPVDALPRNDAGKVLRRDLAALFETGAEER